MNRLLSLLLLCSLQAQAGVTVVEPWVRTTAPGQKVAAGYVRIVSDKDVALVSANSSFADKVEVHEMQMDDGIMRMRPLKQLELKANTPVELKPGGLHLMLVGIKNAVKAGDAIPLTLVFEDKKAARESVDVVFNGRAVAHQGMEHHAH
ncbi:copper chaperone PCu(A)C [Methylobacillus sp. Pita2]|uniref:copper chaperone PCu(A)C n=1 Tax=Methylobacillus TaxID=404 RepID=UPI0028538E4E|nr:copper chaperone PCu(A)C [Methylobacillus flagellatus]MDR5171150.1 copper chaperone PCu(A)C [Methylobacillus flagellatus]